MFEVGKKGELEYNVLNLVQILFLSLQREEKGIQTEYIQPPVLSIQRSFHFCPFCKLVLC